MISYTITLSNAINSCCRCTQRNRKVLGQSKMLEKYTHVRILFFIVFEAILRQIYLHTKIHIKILHLSMCVCLYDFSVIFLLSDNSDRIAPVCGTE